MNATRGVAIVGMRIHRLRGRRLLTQAYVVGPRVAAGHSH